MSAKVQRKKIEDWAGLHDVEIVRRWRSGHLQNERVQLAAFLAVAVVIVVTPGVDMALVTKNALAHGREAALATALGINAGIAVWTLAAALGLAAVLQQSAIAFSVIKLAGAVYLIYLGLRTLLTARRRGRAALGSHPRTPPGARDAFRQGFLSNVLNPKIAVLFTSLLPQFIEPGAAAMPALLMLGALFNVLGLVWLTCYALAAARGRVVLQRPRIRAALDYLTGTVLVALGIRVALEPSR